MKMKKILSVFLVSLLLVLSFQVTTYANDELVEKELTTQLEINENNEENQDEVEILPKQNDFEKKEAKYEGKPANNEELVDREVIQLYADEDLPANVKQVTTGAELEIANNDKTTTEIIIMNDIVLEDYVYIGVNKSSKGDNMTYRGITPDVTITVDDTYKYKYMFQIGSKMNATFKDLILDGNNKVYQINGRTTDRIHTVIENVEFRNNGSDESAVLIYSTSGTLTVNNSKFISNKDGKDGGGIYYYAYNKEVNDPYRSKVTINNTVFEDNEANGSGGAVYLRGSYRQIVGGAYEQIYIDAEIKNSTFRNNISNYKGALTFTGGGTLLVDNSTFDGNKAKGADKKGYGAGINTNSFDGHVIDVNIKDSKFINNSSTAYGTVRLDGGGTSIIENSVFENNEGSDGGAIHTESNPGKRFNLTVTDSKFSENFASGSTGESGYGGAIRFHGTGSITVKNSTFDNNKAINRLNLGMGGAISIHEARFKENNPENVKGITAKLIDNQFTNNHSVYGGALSTYDAVDLTISGNNVFKNNTATQRGGAFASFTTERVESVEDFTFFNEDPSNTLIEDAKFIGNSSGSNISNGKGRGGAIFLSNELESPTTIRNTLFEDNSAQFGGAINSSVDWYAQTGTKLSIFDTDFKDNKAGQGGGILLKRRADLLVERSNFINNSAKYDGGAINSDIDGRDTEDSIKGNITIRETNFNNNSAQYGGGIILSKTIPADNTIDDLIIENSVFDGNHATDYGGGIINFVPNSRMIIKDTSFEKNNANINGGGIHIHNEDKRLDQLAKTIITNSIFKGNTAGELGGGINVLKRGNDLTKDTDANVRYYEELLVSDTIFENNTAGFGIFRLNPLGNPRINGVYKDNIKDLKSISKPHSLEKNIAYNNYDISFLSADISGEKTWNHGTNLPKNRPESIVIILYADGKEIDKKTVTALESWKYDFTGHDIFNENGERIIYTVDEEPVDRYEKTLNGMDIKNTYIEPIIDYEVTKTDNLDSTIIKKGDEFEYNISIKNQGYIELTNIVVSDNIPHQLSILDVNLSHATINGQLVELTIPRINIGETVTITIKVKVNDTAKDGDKVLNIAIVNDEEVPSRELIVEEPNIPVDPEVPFEPEVPFLPGTGISNVNSGLIFVLVGSLVVIIGMFYRKNKNHRDHK